MSSSSWTAGFIFTVDQVHVHDIILYVTDTAVAATADVSSNGEYARLFGGTRFLVGEREIRAFEGPGLDS